MFQPCWSSVCYGVPHNDRGGTHFGPGNGRNEWYFPLRHALVGSERSGVTMRLSLCQDSIYLADVEAWYVLCTLPWCCPRRPPAPMYESSCGLSAWIWAIDLITVCVINWDSMHLEGSSTVECCSLMVLWAFHSSTFPAEVLDVASEQIYKFTSCYSPPKYGLVHND